MRENCTYGSMRGRAFPTGRPALLYTLLDLASIDIVVGQEVMIDSRGLKWYNGGV